MFSLIQRTRRLSNCVNGYSHIIASTLHTTTNKNCREQHDLTNFSLAEETQIVDTINKTSLKDFDKYDIKKSQFKKLLAYRARNGKFASFNDLLVTQDIPLFIKLCQSILNGGKTTQKNETNAQKIGGIIPPVEPITALMIKSVLGIYVWGDKISWAKINDQCTLTHWNCQTFENTSKVSSAPLINLVINIVATMPHADAYVMEADAYVSLGKLKSADYLIHVQRQQVIAVILSILEMRRRANDIQMTSLNKFYTLQARTSSRRFNLFLGSETISSEHILDDILDGKIFKTYPNLPPVIIPQEIVRQYKSHDLITREQLRSVFLVTLAFADLIKFN